MARGFGSTFGVGTTDLVQSLFASRSLQRSWHSWAYINGLGGAGNGRIFQSASPGYELLFVGTGPVLYFQRKFSTQDAIFHLGTTTNSVWNSIGVSYDCSSTSNVASAYFNGIAQSVTISQAPLGTADMTPGAYTIGNDPAGVRNWDGIIGEFAIWDTILTQIEFTALSNGIKAHLIRPGSLKSYWTFKESDGVHAVKVPFNNSAYTMFPSSVIGTKVVANPPNVWGNRNGINSLTQMPVINSPWLVRKSAIVVSSVFRRTASRIGTRTGTRQTWAA